MNEEIWKDIPGWDGIYQVSNLGRICRCGYQVNPWIQKQGYMVVALSRNGSVTKFLFHRLVAMTFHPNPEKMKCVNHKNGIKSDNRAENLEWCTSSQNNAHAFKTGLKKPTIMQGEMHGCCVLTEQQVHQIRREFVPFKNTRKMLSEKYGVSEGTIKAILCRRLWAHI